MLVFAFLFTRNTSFISLICFVAICEKLTKITVCNIVKVLHNSHWLVVLVTLLLYSRILKFK